MAKFTTFVVALAATSLVASASIHETRMSDVSRSGQKFSVMCKSAFADDESALKMPLRLPGVASPIPTLQKHGTHKSSQRKAAKATRSDEGVYNVHVEFRYTDGERPDCAIAFAPGYTDYYDYEGEDYIDFELPAGTYNFMAKYYNNGFGPQIFVVHEDVTIDKDETIVLDAAEATKVIHFTSKMPNGDLCRLPVADFSQDIYDPVWDTSESNVDDIYFTEFMMHDDCGVIASMSGSASYTNTAGVSGEVVFDYQVNDLSDKFHFLQYRALPSGDNLYAMFMQTDGVENLEVSNDVANYHHYEESFEHTPVFDSYGCETWYSKMIVYGLINEEYVSTFEIKSTSLVPQIDYCAPLPDMDSDRVVRCLIYPEQLDYEERILFWQETDDEGNVISEFYWPVDYGVIGLPINYTESGFEYVNNNHSIYGDYGFQMPEGGGTVVEYPGNPAFSFVEGEKTAPYGASAPMVAFMTQTVDEEDYETPVVWFKPCFIGRFGEVRLSDEVGMGLDIRHNGESVIGDDLEDFSFEDWAWEWAETEHEKGLMTVLLQDRNILVDGLQGETFMVIGYDEHNEDLCAPTLQMLQFKNVDGAITDRFEKAADGVLEFAGGDFNWHDDGFNWWFDEKEATVKVEYGRYGVDDDFEELAVEEVPELYFMPGFGHFYRGSLESVNRASETGWFDLRITMTDASNNYQMQTISPAFKIEETMGVNRVTSNLGALITACDGRICVKADSDANVRIYSMDGCRVGFNNRTMQSDAVAPGTYLVKVVSNGVSTTAKLIVR